MNKGIGVGGKATSAAYGYCTVHVILLPVGKQPTMNKPINSYKIQRVSETSPCLLFFPDFLLVLSLLSINQRLVLIFRNDMY